LNQAAIRSGQQSLIEQLGAFQSACRDAVRRMGIAAFVANPNDPFDPKFHQTHDSQAMSMHNPRVRETLATGFTYQGQIIRAALVALQNPPPAGKPAENPAEAELLPLAATKEITDAEQTLL
jgi:molecular chaperone GrpE (heat shock protein)